MKKINLLDMACIICGGVTLTFGVIFGILAIRGLNEVLFLFPYGELVPEALLLTLAGLTCIIGILRKP